MIAHFYAATLADSCESNKIIFAAFAYFPYLCSVQPFYGLSRKKISGYSHYTRYFFVLFRIFPRKRLAVSKKHAIFATSYKIIEKMTTTLLKRQFLHAMVWKAETPQCFSIRHRTPKACLFINPKIYRYDCKNQFRR